MEEHEYLERFRLAILWDEFRRRPFPVVHKLEDETDSDLPRHINKKVSNRRRSRFTRDRYYLYINPIGQPRRSLPKFDWEDFLHYSQNVAIYINSFFMWGDIKDIRFSIPAFQMYIFGLRTHIEDIRNSEIKDYYQHLLYVADEVLKELKAINGLK
jgi:hypothetical protein